MALVPGLSSLSDKPGLSSFSITFVDGWSKQEEVRKMRVLRGILLVALMALALAAPARAQALGQIFGVVTDSTGSVLPGVTVTVTGTGLQQPLVMQSTQTGAYRFPNVPIGTYTITFELSGFKKVARAGVLITTGFAAPVDQKMEIGAVQEQVT